MAAAANRRRDAERIGLALWPPGAHCVRHRLTYATGGVFVCADAPAGYDRGMEERNGPSELEIELLDIGMAFFAIGFFVGVIAAITGYPEIVSVYPGAFAAGFVVWLTVRLFNRSGDPRRAKSPPDAP